MGSVNLLLTPCFRGTWIKDGVCSAGFLSRSRYSNERSVTCGIGDGGGDRNISWWLRALAAHRSQSNQLHELVITSKDADAEGVRREHDD